MVMVTVCEPPVEGKLRLVGLICRAGPVAVAAEPVNEMLVGELIALPAI